MKNKSPQVDAPLRQAQGALPLGPRPVSRHPPRYAMMVVVVVVAVVMTEMMMVMMVVVVVVVVVSLITIRHPARK